MLNQSLLVALGIINNFYYSEPPFVYPLLRYILTNAESLPGLPIKNNQISR